MMIMCFLLFLYKVNLIKFNLNIFNLRGKMNILIGKSQPLNILYEYIENNWTKVVILIFVNTLLFAPVK